MFDFPVHLEALVPLVRLVPLVPLVSLVHLLFCSNVANACFANPYAYTYAMDHFARISLARASQCMFSKPLCFAMFDFPQRTCILLEFS